jgi:hypothetical protein
MHSQNTARLLGKCRLARGHRNQKPDCRCEITQTWLHFRLPPFVVPPLPLQAQGEIPTKPCYPGPFY